ncbi:MAG: flavin reductase [Chloroflexi bacterium]|nr:flavin reductase [Chloroflexota bacterium]
MELGYDMLTHGVYIVTTRHEGKLGGLAVAWATQVAQDRILICLGSGSATRQLILASKVFGLSVLTDGQVDLARAFGRRSIRNTDKFVGIGYHTLVTGSPLLDDCAATFDCQVEAMHDDGQRKLIVGRIVAMERLQETYEPLIYRAADY